MKPKLPTTLTLSQLIMLTGITQQGIAEHVKTGTITKVGDNAYDIKSVPVYCARLRKGASGSDLTPQRARLTKTRADVEEIKRKRLTGELVPASQVERVWGQAIAMARAHLLAIPAKLAERIGLCKSPFEAQQIMRREIEGAMLELSAVSLDATDAYPEGDESHAGSEPGSRTEDVAASPGVSVSEWSDQNRVLSFESSAEPGRWQTFRAEYLREIMDSVLDPRNHAVVVAKSSQVGGTEMLNNVAGYYIDQDPALILMVQPTLELGEAWSKDRLAPMLRDTRTLRGKVSDVKSRDTDNTLRHKVFPGGSLTIVGANAPSGLAARPIRVVLADEVDRYPVSAGTEGNPLALAAKRQQTFWNRKTMICSTPLHRATSIVWNEWEKSDQRRYFVPCPECGVEQYLKWSSVHWSKDKEGRHLPKTAHYCCEHCGALWTDVDRDDAVRKGRWVPTAAFNGQAGFHISGLMSPWLKLEGIVREFLNSKKRPDLLQVWTNTVLGEPWEDLTEKVEGSTLINRAESYGPDSLPIDVRFLTAGVDTQGNRLELQVVGWGAGEESWVVDYEILLGDPAQPQIWQDLDGLLLRPYHNETGRQMMIQACCIDMLGHHGNQVLQFCDARRARMVLPIGGTPGPRPVWPKRATETKTHSRVYMIGVDTAKDVIYGRLKILQKGPDSSIFRLMMR